VSKAVLRDSARRIANSHHNRRSDKDDHAPDRYLRECKLLRLYFQTKRVVQKIPGGLIYISENEAVMHLSITKHCPAEASIYLPKQNDEQHNQHDEAQTAAGIIAPTGTVGPRR